MIATPSRTLLVVADNPDTQALILEHARAKGLKVVPAKFGNDAGMIGSAAVALELAARA